VALEGAAVTSISAPFYPIIYVRGFAMTRSEIESMTATTYMGINLGATKARQHCIGNVTPRYLGLPLILLSTDYVYLSSQAGGLKSL